MKDERNGLHDNVPEFSAFWSSRPLSAALTKYMSLLYCLIVSYSFMGCNAQIFFSPDSQ